MRIIQFAKIYAKLFELYGLLDFLIVQASSISLKC